MARMGFDPSKQSRWPIAFPVPLLPISTGAFDLPANCMGINRWWLNLMILASDVLLDERSWEGATEDQLWFMRQQLVLVQERLRQIDGCDGGEVEQPEVTIEQDGDCKRILINGSPATEWICTSIERVTTEFEDNQECEEDCDMGCTVSPENFRFFAGKFQVKGCDGWVDIQGQNAPIATTQTASGDAAASSFDGWGAAGYPALPEQPQVGSSIPGYTTNDSLKCAKATALVDALYSFLSVDAEVGQAADDGGTITDLISLAITGLTGVPLAFLNDFVSQWKVGIANSFDVESYTAEAAAIMADSALKAEIVCKLTDRVVAPGQVGVLKLNRVTDADIQALIDVFIETAEPSSDFELRTKASLVLYLAQNSTAHLDTVDCGCDDLLPYGYVPSTAIGKIQFEAMVYAGAAGINDFHEPANYAGLNRTVHGSKIGAANFRTAYIGGSSPYYQAAGILLLLPTGCAISEMKYTDARSGSYDEVKLALCEFKADDTFHIMAYDAPASAGAHTKSVSSTAGAKHLYIQVKASGLTGTGQSIDFSAIKFTGSMGGTGFVDKGIGELLT